FKQMISSHRTLVKNGCKEADRRFIHGYGDPCI
ncbi:hypothetical protein A3Q56_08759, partial [Intoshia linei]